CIIQTLEEIEYGGGISSKPKDGNGEIESDVTGKSASEKVAQRPAAQLAGKSLSIRENQTNVSYDNLFGEYLVGADAIEIVDPYVRLPYQVRNLMEFCRLVLSKRADEQIIKIHLKTFNTDDKIQEMIDTFDDLKASLESMSVEFSYEFDEHIHDRSITLSNGWVIALGRGLDIWHRIGGMLDFAEYYQEKRQCKEFTMYVVKKN